jgi:hypothetical protein
MLEVVPIIRGKRRLQIQGAGRDPRVLDTDRTSHRAGGGPQLCPFGAHRIVRIGDGEAMNLLLKQSSASQPPIRGDRSRSHLRNGHERKDEFKTAERIRKRLRRGMPVEELGRNVRIDDNPAHPAGGRLADSRRSA